MQLVAEYMRYLLGEKISSGIQPQVVDWLEEIMTKSHIFLILFSFWIRPREAGILLNLSSNDLWSASCNRTDIISLSSFFEFHLLLSRHDVIIPLPWSNMSRTIIVAGIVVILDLLKRYWGDRNIRLLSRARELTCNPWGEIYFVPNIRMMRMSHSSNASLLLWIRLRRKVRCWAWLTPSILSAYLLPRHRAWFPLVPVV